MNSNSQVIYLLVLVSLLFGIAVRSPVNVNTNIVDSPNSEVQQSHPTTVNVETSPADN